MYETWIFSLSGLAPRQQMAKQNVRATGTRDANQDQWFSSFSSAPAGTYDCEMALTETSVGRRFFRAALSAANVHGSGAKR
jgi:hypothetical protein